MIGGLNTLAFDISAQVPPSSWYGTLLKGTINLSPQTTVAQAVVWSLYIVPVMYLFLRSSRPVRRGAVAAALLALRRARRLRRVGEQAEHAVGGREAARPGTIGVTARDDACETTRTSIAPGAAHAQRQERRLAGHRGLRLRRGRPDHRRGREHRPGAHARPRRAAPARQVRGRVQARHGRQRHPPAADRERASRRPARQRPAERRRSPTTAATCVGESRTLLALTIPFAKAVKQGDIALAKQRYAVARVHYERIEPIAESFPVLDTAIDIRADGVEPGAPWRGFHRLEHDLWKTGDISQDGPLADQLVRDIRALVTTVGKVDITPEELGNGARSLMDEVAKGKVTGEEERYSHTDLVDFQGNLDGAKTAYAELRPILATRDPALAKTLDTRFAHAPAAAEHARRRRAVQVLHRAHAAGDPRSRRSCRRGRRAALAGHGGRAAMSTVSRRGLLLGAGAGAALLAGCGEQGRAGGRRPDPVVPFFGAHQAGIATPVQDRLHFADVRPARRDDPRRPRRPAAHLDLGRGGDGGRPGDRAAAAIRTRRRWTPARRSACTPSRLTITAGLRDVAVRPSVRAGERAPAGARRPARVPGRRPRPRAQPRRPLHPGLRRRPAGRRARGPQPRPARPRRRRRALQPARLRPHVLHHQRPRRRPRNLFGFKDGTANLKLEDQAALRRHVWVQPGDGPRLDDRRLLPRRPADPDDDRELGPRLARRPGAGDRPPQGHRRPVRRHRRVRAARPRPRSRSSRTSGSPTRDSNGGAQLLRRGYSFVDGSDGLGRLDAGLYFLAYQRDPRTQFVHIQQHLAGKHSDAMNEYITHVGSGLYAIPPGVQRGGFWGETLLN